MERLNTRPFKKIAGVPSLALRGTRARALRPLPLRPYEFGEWKKAKVHPDYHIEVGRAYYSVPYALIGERVDVRLTANGVEIFHGGELVAAHARARERGERARAVPTGPESHVAIIEQTLEHTLMPRRPDRRRYRGADPPAKRCGARIRKRPCAVRKGSCAWRMTSVPRELERACERALALKSYSYRAVRTLISRRAGAGPRAALDLPHENLRGAAYFDSPAD